MRIALVNTIPIWGGGEQWTFDAALELANRGHDVGVVASDDGELIGRTKGAGLASLKFANGRRQASTIKDLRRAFKVLPEVWLSNCIQDVWLVNCIQLLRGKAPLIYRRGLDDEIADNFIHRWRFHSVRTILVNSDATGRTIRSSFPWFPTERIVRLYNSIDPKRFFSYPHRNLRAELDLSAEAFIIGVVGRLVEQKGHRLVIEAMPAVLKAMPEARLLLAGDGPLRENLETLARRLGVMNACRFLGQIGPIQPFYEACDIVAIPSLFEGFCYAALEAQLMKKPVIASDVSSLPEVVRNQESGVLVTGGDVGGFAAQILRLGRDRALRMSMGERGHRHALEAFAPKPTYDRLEQILYQNAAKSQSRAV